MRSLLQPISTTLLWADAVVGAGHGWVTLERVTQRNGERHRDLDTRVGTIDVAIAKLHYVAAWQLEHRKRAESALITVVADFDLDCGLAGVRPVTSDAHAGLRDAIAANLPGATWQRCRTHYAANLVSVTPKSMWPAVKARLHSVDDLTLPRCTPRLTDSRTTSLASSPTSVSTSTVPVPTASPSPTFPRTCGPRKRSSCGRQTRLRTRAQRHADVGPAAMDPRQHRPGPARRGLATRDSAAENVVRRGTDADVAAFGVVGTISRVPDRPAVR